MVEPGFQTGTLAPEPQFLTVVVEGNPWSSLETPACFLSFFLFLTMRFNVIQMPQVHIACMTFL